MKSIGENLAFFLRVFLEELERLEEISIYRYNILSNGIGVFVEITPKVVVFILY